MLQLPASLNIRRAHDSEDRLIDYTKKWLEKEERDPRIHVSDLLDPRMGYWNRAKPKDLSDRLATIFMVGKVLHAFVLSAVDGETGTNWATDIGSQYSKELDLVWSADKIIKNIPRELKTSRSYYEPKEKKDLALYCEQLLCYMIVKKKTKGQLWILFLNTKNADGKTAPCFRCYTITISKEDLLRYQNQMVNVRSALQVALKKKTPDVLPLCRRFKCGADNCEHWYDCKPKGRYGINPKQWRDTERDLLIQIARPKRNLEEARSTL